MTDKAHLEGAIQIGAAYIFDYPAAFVTLPAYTAHAGQTVTVVRQLRDDECDPECQPMFEVRAADGWIGHADSSELTHEWSGAPDPIDPDNFWIDDETGERVNAHTGERTEAEGPVDGDGGDGTDTQTAWLKAYANGR